MVSSLHFSDLPSVISPPLGALPGTFLAMSVNWSRSGNAGDLEKGMVFLTTAYPEAALLRLPVHDYRPSHWAGPGVYNSVITIPTRHPVSIPSRTGTRLSRHHQVIPQYVWHAGDKDKRDSKYLHISLAIRDRKPLPKIPRRWIRLQLWYNTYRKFFTVVISFNLIAVLVAALGEWNYSRRYTGALVLGNLQLAILVRNELCCRCLYFLVNTVFAKWPPLWFRLGCTSALQHLGGIHSGCAVSGCVWLLFHMVLFFHNLKDTHVAIVVMGLLTNIALVVGIISALPWVRNHHHNVFERSHRFSGWIGLLFTWLFVILGDNYDTATHSWSRSGVRMLRQQDFLFTLFMTVFVAIPWLTVREVDVDVEIPSPKVAILRFSGGMQQGLLTRIARNAALEYHAFGIVSEGPQSPYHYLICGVQGDFTSSLVTDPPRTLWTRELKFAGVSNTSTLYKRGIRVCTGTGLGAALSTCLQSSDWYLIWIGSDQEKTFGPTISRLIHSKIGPKRATLWDTKKRGRRPDIMRIIKKAYRYWQAEVVFITSNAQGNREMMEGCKEAGIPAFGTLWDF